MRLLVSSSPPNNQPIFLVVESVRDNRSISREAERHNTYPLPSGTVANTLHSCRLSPLIHFLVLPQSFLRVCCSCFIILIYTTSNTSLYLNINVLSLLVPVSILLFYHSHYHPVLVGSSILSAILSIVYPQCNMFFSMIVTVLLVH